MKLRIAVVGALVVGSVFVGVGPASATCRPERPNTCEVEYPPLEPEPSCDGAIYLPDGTTVTVNYCDPSQYIPE